MKLGFRKRISKGVTLATRGIGFGLLFSDFGPGLGRTSPPRWILAWRRVPWRCSRAACC